MDKKTLQRLGLLLREAGELLLQEADGAAVPAEAGDDRQTAQLVADAQPNDKQRAQAARTARRLGLTPARPRGRGSAA